jgi:hypothetical protein
VELGGFLVSSPFPLKLREYNSGCEMLMCNRGKTGSEPGGMNGPALYVACMEF